MKRKILGYLLMAPMILTILGMLVVYLSHHPDTLLGLLIGSILVICFSVGTHLADL